MGGDITGIRIFSESDDNDLLTEKFKQTIDIPIKAVTSLNDFTEMDDRTIDPLCKQDGISVSVPLGIMFGDAKQPINLLPQDFKDIARVGDRKRQWVILSILILITVGLTYFALWLQKGEKMQVLKKGTWAQKNAFPHTPHRMHHFYPTPRGAATVKRVQYHRHANTGAKRVNGSRRQQNKIHTHRPHTTAKLPQTPKPQPHICPHVPQHTTASPTHDGQINC